MSAGFTVKSDVDVSDLKRVEANVLIAAGTIEEKIIRLHQNKHSMADALLQDADMFAQISADDVIKLLRESVDAIGEGEYFRGFSLCFEKKV